jgi:hypothetical protein
MNAAVMEEENVMAGPNDEAVMPAAVEDPEPISRPSMLRRFESAFEWCFGMVTIVVGLAVLAAVPVLNFLSLGYLLRVSGNVAATGRLRDGFIGVRKAARAGGIIAGTWLVLLFARFVSGLWQDAELIAPGSGKARGFGIAVVVLTVLTVIHIGWAWARGGRLRSFFWPAPIALWRRLRNPGRFEDYREAVLGYLESLRLPYYFWLGARGFGGALCWLLPPVAVLIGASYLPVGGGVVFSLLGGFGLFLVVLYLPFLQVNFVLQDRLVAMFEWREVRRMFGRAPTAFWFALFITLLFALPLYLLKVELTPKEVAWLPGLVFVLFIFPARSLTGWAVSRARRREGDSFFLFRWVMRLLELPVVGFYVLFVYLSQFYSWDGVYSLLEQHAFMVPAPLMGM